MRYMRIQSDLLPIHAIECFCLSFFCSLFINVSEVLVFFVYFLVHFSCLDSITQVLSFTTEILVLVYAPEMDAVWKSLPNEKESQSVWVKTRTKKNKNELNGSIRRWTEWKAMSDANIYV